jgi:hypothetical protein
MAKKKYLDKLLPHLVTDAEGVCTFQGTVPFTLAYMVCTAPLPHAHIA